MKIFSRICLVAAVVCSLMFVATPGAYALPRADSQPESTIESGWLEAAFDWVQSLLGLEEQFRDGQEKKIFISNEEIQPQHNGSCIDPLGGCWGG